MDLYGAHVPVSWWTAVALAGGVALSAVLWRPLARLRGWRPRWTLATLLSLSAVLALTLTPGDEPQHLGIRGCIPREPADLRHLVFHTGGGIVADLLNVVLTLPLTLSIVAATRRVWSALVLSPLLPLCIELTQTMIPGRVCAVSDLVTNTIGGLLGMMCGLVLRANLRRRVRRTAADVVL